MTQRNDPLSRLCVSRLTRLLELNTLEELESLGDNAYVAQNVELDDIIHQKTHNSHNYKRKIKKIFKFLTRKETPLVFGQEISEQTVELIIELVDHLKCKTSTDGLFRISGNKKRQEELKGVLNRGGKLDLEDAMYSSHDIAGILKQFFGELPEPLLTKQLYDCYQQLADMDSFLVKERKLETLQYLFLLLPPLNRLLLRKLLELLSVVADDEANRMSSYNLGVVFAPNIVCTRQPMSCLSEFTDNVEPFTELVKFIIENAEDVFKVPEDFIKETREYMCKIETDQDAEVPIQKAFCKQKDTKNLHKETKNNTDDALAMLYSHMMEMPDGPKKTEFMQKFKQSYPGTPMFIPKSVQDRRRNSSKENLDEFTSTPVNMETCEQNKHETPQMLRKGQLTPIKANHAITSTPCNGSPVFEKERGRREAPRTPGSRMRQALKRMRRRSVEIFKPKPSKIPTPERPDPPSQPVFSRMKDVFRRSQRGSNSVVKLIKKSISTPSLTRKKSGSSVTDFSVNNDRYRSQGASALFNGTFNRTLDELKPKDGGPIEFNFERKPSDGVFNDAFYDNTNDTPLDSRTPDIRKALYPELLKPMRNDSPLDRVSNFFNKRPACIQKGGAPVGCGPLKVMEPACSIEADEESLNDITNIESLNRLLTKKLSIDDDAVEDDKSQLQPAFARFKERRSYRKFASDRHQQVHGLEAVEGET